MSSHQRGSASLLFLLGVDFVAIEGVETVVGEVEDGRTVVVVVDSVVDGVASLQQVVKVLS